jgi:hypothetical protein
VEKYEKLKEKRHYRKNELLYFLKLSGFGKNNLHK